MDDPLPLRYLGGWGPMRLDALGLVTMLGADEVNAAVGRLAFSRYTEYLPLLGAFVVAGNQFTRPLSGFTFYNINDAMTTTDWAGWFSRYVQARKVRQSVTELSIEVCPSATRWADILLAASIGMVVNGGLFAIAILSADWWGFLNVLSMLVSVIVRAFLVHQNRQALDQAADKALRSDSRTKRILCILPDAKMLTMNTSTALLRECLIRSPTPPNRRLYKLVQIVGWLFFGAHVITIGMSILAVQIVTVVVLCVSTVLVVWNIGCQKDRIGSRLSIKQDDMDEGKLNKVFDSDNGTGDRRQNAYVFLKPTDLEVESLLSWGLLPHKSNKDWWKVFEAKRQAWPERMEALGCRYARTWSEQETLVASPDPEMHAQYDVPQNAPQGHLKPDIELDLRRDSSRR